MASPDTYPRLFGKYVLIGPLARGGMGELHLAVAGRGDLRKLCVIKQILGHLGDEEFTRRFVDEAKLVVQLSHGNLVPIFESGLIDGRYYLSMEYIEGKDLRTVWNAMEGRPMPLEVALHLAKELCRGLSYAHSFGDLQLVHRDVSPPNVLLSYSGEVRLTDFGLASSTIKMQKTSPGVLFGKLAYMSPEQARNEAVDERADVYSLGVIFWELITGQRLFPKEGSQLDQLKRVANPQVPAPSKVNRKLPPPLDLIVLRALAPRRDDRYATAELFRRELAGFLAKLDPTTDAAAVQRLLAQIFGAAIDDERRQRQQLLEEMTPRIHELLDAKVSTGVATEGAEEEKLFVDESTPPPTLAPGTMLGGRYRIEDLIREGGMGTVYLALHVDIEKRLAVKVLHPIYTRMPEVVSRFRQEARAASRIGHPNIVEVFDSGITEDGSFYFVMEHLEGLDLADTLGEDGPFPEERVTRVAVQICHALEAAHEAGIVHRDLKPENVFLTTREGAVDFVKVLDFGIAQMGHLEDSRRVRLTNPGIAMGTPEYMSPEQAAGKGCDHRADIYAVGALLYEMLVGEPPHAGDNLLEVLNRKATEEIRPPSEHRPELSGELERIVLWALERDPERRPQSMAQLAYELTKLTSGRSGAVASMLGLPDDPLGTGASPMGIPSPRALDLAREPFGPGEEFRPDLAVTASVKAPPRHRAAPALLLILIGLGALATVVALPLWSRKPRSAGAGTAPRPSAPVAVAEPRSASVQALRAQDAGTQPSEEASATQVAASAPVRPSGGRARLSGTKSAAGRSATSSMSAGLRHLRAGRFAEARTAFETARRSPKDRGRALVGLAEVEFQLGQYHAAQVFAQVAASEGAGLQADLIRGNIFFKLHDYKNAMRMYERVLGREEGHREARRNLEAARRQLRTR
ncbi:MAG: protein kinase [Deltaproteobacteria bacterium]|nr:protein kinase [Deltaproteobacteria bacterium]